MSSLGQLQFEVEGDWREGLLKIEATQMYQLKVPEPQNILSELRYEIVNAFSNLDFGLNGLEKPGWESRIKELLHFMVHQQAPIGMKMIG